jgi:hypothetical protein
MKPQELARLRLAAEIARTSNACPPVIARHVERITKHARAVVTFEVKKCNEPLTEHQTRRGNWNWRQLILAVESLGGKVVGGSLTVFAYWPHMFPAGVDVEQQTHNMIPLG